MKHILRLLLATALLGVSTLATAQRYGKVIDKTIAVVGNEMILISDLEQGIQEARLQGMASDEKARCELLERMLESKLFLLQARLDSLSINQDMVQSQLSQHIDMMRTRLGGDEAVEEAFGKPLYKLRQEWKKQMEDMSLTQQEQMEIANQIPRTYPQRGEILHPGPHLFRRSRQRPQRRRAGHGFQVHLLAGLLGRCDVAQARDDLPGR